MTRPEAFWNMRARNYDQQIGPMYEEAYRKTLENTVKYFQPHFRVLDFACGTGIVTLPMAAHAAHVEAIDISPEMVERIREKVSSQGIENLSVRQLDLFDPALEPGSFDAVTAFNVLCYVEDPQRLLRRIMELLKPGGYFLSATDCLGQVPTRVGLKKWWKSHTGSMPYVAFYRMSGLEREVAAAGFTVLERENLFPAPPNLFLAARQNA